MMQVQQMTDDEKRDMYHKLNKAEIIEKEYHERVSDYQNDLTESITVRAVQPGM